MCFSTGSVLFSLKNSDFFLDVNLLLLNELTLNKCFLSPENRK